MRPNKFKQPNGVIYFIRFDMPGGPIKIGFTKTSVRGRIKNLQQISPYPIQWIGFFDGHYTDERKAHRKLHRSCLRGEWFHPTEEVLAFVAEKCPSFDPVYAEDIPYERPSKGVSRINLEIAA